MPGENAGEESAGECRSLLVQSPGAVSYSGWRPLSSGRLQRRESELQGILSQGYRPVKNTVQNTIQSLSRTLCKCVATLWSSPTAWHYALSPCPFTMLFAMAIIHTENLSSRSLSLESSESLFVPKQFAANGRLWRR